MKDIRSPSITPDAMCAHSGWLSLRLEGRFLRSVWHKRYGNVLRTSDPSVVALLLFENEHTTAPSEHLEIDLAAAEFHTRKGMLRKAHRFQVDARLVGEPQNMPSYRFEFAVRSRKELQAWREVLTDGHDARESRYCKPSGDSDLPELADPHEASTSSVDSNSFDMLLSCRDLSQRHRVSCDSSAGVAISMATTATSISTTTRGQSRHDSAASVTDRSSSRALVCCSTPTQAIVACIFRSDQAPCGRQVMCLECVQRVMRATQRCPLCCSDVSAAPRMFSRT